MNTWGDVSGSSNLQSGRVPHKESFDWHNDDTHELWRPPQRCLSCGGHRVASVRGRRPAATWRYGFWALLAEWPMRMLAKSMLKRDPRAWPMDEPDTQFGTEIHQQIIHYHEDADGRE